VSIIQTHTHRDHKTWHATEEKKEHEQKLKDILPFIKPNIEAKAFPTSLKAKTNIEILASEKISSQSSTLVSNTLPLSSRPV